MRVLGLLLLEKDAVLLLMLLLLKMLRHLMVLLLLKHGRVADGNILHNNDQQKPKNASKTISTAYLQGLLQRMLLLHHHDRLRLALHHAGGKHVALMRGWLPL